MLAALARRVYASMNLIYILSVYTRAITITFYLINKNLFTFASIFLHVKVLEINWSKNNPAGDVHSPLSTVIGDVHCEFSPRGSTLGANFLYLPVCAAQGIERAAHSGHRRFPPAPPQLLIIVYFGK